MGAIKKKLLQKKYNNTLEPRPCRRCGKDFRFLGMRKYCQDCLEVLKADPYEYKKIKREK